MGSLITFPTPYPYSIERKDEDFNVYGIIPDLRYGSTFDIGRYGWVGDSNWLTLLHYQWLAITPFWPVSPDELCLFRTDERDRALEWVRTGGDPVRHRT
jgi:hypothetical protein